MKFLKVNQSQRHVKPDKIDCGYCGNSLGKLLQTTQRTIFDDLSEYSKNCDLSRGRKSRSGVNPKVHQE